jgi:hypothetical protein
VDTRSLYDTDVYAWAMQQASALRSEAARTLEPLLKLGHSPANDPRNHWASEVVHQRARLERRLKKNPALRSRLPDVVDGAYQDGRRLAAFGLARDGLSLADLPETCPYTLDQIRTSPWIDRCRS